ncbi:MAG: hypothetical protein IJM12_01230 [Bacteroidales bacterium]|jgi:hypothetical protein|nr:hypothetical protein [Bacteroidales bacterium]
MKKSVFALVCLIGAIFFTSCNTSKFFSQKASDIQPIALVESYSYITDAVGDFSTYYLPDASRFNQLLITDIVTSLGMPIKKTVTVDFDAEHKGSKLDSWMYNLVDISANKAQHLIVPDEIRNAVRNSGCRYGLLITDVGYSKNANQLALEEGIEVGMRIADFIFNNSVEFSKETEAYLNGVYALVFDSQTGEAVWYGSRPRRYEYNPLDRQSLTKQLTSLFKDFQ